MDNSIYDIVRERYNAKENGLQPYACYSKDAIRLRAEEEDYRSSFCRDKDRILHSNSFTRYMDKTQVFTRSENDHISKRIIHVTLVGQIAREIGIALGLNEYLIEAMAYGHDLGHTPLGHAGEAILNEISLRELGQYFAHNIQSVRNLMSVERSGRGLNLSVQVLDGIMCHNGEILSCRYEPVEKDAEEFLREYEEAYYDLRKANQNRPMTLEGCVVRISDVIAYIGRDIEDAITLGIIHREEIPEEIRSVLGTKNNDIINTIVTDIIENSMNKPYIEMSEKVFNALHALKDFNYKHIYAKSMTEEQLLYYKTGMNLIYNHYIYDLQNQNKDSIIYTIFLNEQCPEYLSQTPIQRQAIDFIAGMTDEFFIKEIERVLHTYRK